MSLQDWKNEFEGKNILIWGYGIEGKSSYHLIRRLLPEQLITIADGGKGKDIAKETTVYTNCISDANLDFSQYDLILKAPGIVVHGEVPAGLTNQAELFLKHYRNRTIGITGTKGKSTTTSLCYALLKEKYPAVLVGNIGIACFDAIDEMENGAYAAFEISCHQLEYCKYSPHIGVYLNLYEEHLDHYGSFGKYGEAKLQNLLHMEEGDIAVMHPMLKEYGYEKRVPVKPVWITEDIYAQGHVLHIPGETLDARNCSLIGNHNYQNLAVAWYIARALGVSDEQCLHAIASFHPLHHRLEDLGEIGGVRYVNDSISTIGQATIRALESINNVDVVLIGGNDRGIDYSELEKYLHERTDFAVVFMYATGKRIAEEMKANNLLRENMIVCEDLLEAMKEAKKLCKPHDTILLSPAASSYDHFKNFEERGAIFEKIAKEIA